MKNSRKLKKHITSIAIMAIAIIALVVVYNKYNYNDFVKSVKQMDKTEFTRDSKEKCSKTNSYKIENKDFNDAMFYETVDVIPNMPYKVTCKVKVENVENENSKKNGGAHICIAGTTQSSIYLSGTKDWQELTLLFNSKNKEKLDIGFRLGGYEENSKGTAWFSDFKIELGNASRDSEWKVGCFIFPNIDVNVKKDGKTEHVKLTMSDNDISDLRTNLARYKNSIKDMSKNKIKVDYDLFTIEEPIKTLSYDDENGYYVSPEDVYDYINLYVQKNEYDHIYVCIRMADIQARKYYFNR